MFSYFESNFIEKFLWESIFFSPNFGQNQNYVILYSLYIYRANFIAKFRLESGFLKVGVQLNPPLGTNESESTLVT